MDKNDELLKEINREQEAQTRLDQVKKDVPRWHVFFYQFFHAIDYILSKYLPPVRWVLKTLFRWYRALWAFFVYKRDENEILVFSKTRAGIFLLISTLYLWFGLPPTANFIFEVTTYALTVEKNETVYLTNSQEIDRENNVHSIQGSQSLPITEDNSFYFRVDDSAFHHFWSIINKGGLFYSDYVAAAVPPGLSKCTATSYGFRLKTLMRGMEIYPHMLSVSCQPINGELSK